MNPEEPDFVKNWRNRNTSAASSTKMDIEENVSLNKETDNTTVTERDKLLTSDM